MKICENGICRDMTEEEITEYMAQNEVVEEIEQLPTIEERIDAIESAMLEVLING